MGAYRDYIRFCNDLGLESKYSYTFNDKSANVANYVDYMLNRSNEMFSYHGLPDTIPQHEIERILQTQGYVVITKVDGKLLACYASLGGLLNEYYEPTTANVAIPYLNYTGVLNIGADCVLIKNDLGNVGLLPLYLKYCTQLIEADISLVLQLVNKRIQAYISASDDNTIKSAEKFLLDVMNGKQGVIADSLFFEQVKTSIVANNAASIKDTIEVIQYLKASLFNEIGLASNYNLKKERVTYADIEMNSENLYPLIDDMLKFRRVGVETVNTLYGTEIEVELNSSWDYRSHNGKSIHDEGLQSGKDNNEIDVDDLETSDDTTPDDTTPDDTTPDDTTSDDTTSDDTTPDDTTPDDTTSDDTTSDDTTSDDTEENKDND